MYSKILDHQDSKGRHSWSGDEPETRAYKGRPWPSPWESAKGKNKRQAPGWMPYPAYEKGKAKKGDKGEKGKGKRQRTDSPQIDAAAVDKAYSEGKYAQWMPNGKESCKNHQKGWCVLAGWQSCGRSHGCPKMLTGGQTCGGPHRAVWCPRE